MDLKKYFKVTFQFDIEDNISSMATYIDKKMNDINAEKICVYEDLGIEEIDYLFLTNNVEKVVNDIIEEGYVKQVKLNCSTYLREYSLLFEFKNNIKTDHINNIFDNIKWTFENIPITTSQNSDTSFSLHFNDKDISLDLINVVNKLSLENNYDIPISIFDWQDTFISQEYSLSNKKKIILK